MKGKWLIMNIIAQNKKIITLSTVLLSALLLTGCGLNSSQSTNDSSTNRNHSSKVIKTHEAKPNHETTNKSDANSISSNSNSSSPLTNSASAQNSPEATQNVSDDSSINPQSNTQTSYSALSAPQSASNSQLTPSNSETQSDSNPTTAPTYQLTDTDVINNFINDSGLILNQGDKLSVAPVDVKAGIYQLELRHTDNTNPQVAHLTTLYTYNVNTHTYSATYQASNPIQTTQQLSLNDTATWSDPDGTIHHVNSDGLDTITTSTGQTTYQDWFGPLPTNAQIVHN